MPKKLSFREEMDLRIRGRLPIERSCPKEGESRWYYNDPRNDTPINVDSPETPNPYIQDIMLEEAKENPQNYYIWRTEEDDRVRSSHAQREGQIFAWDEPPEGGHPGEDYNCRCVAEEFNWDNYNDHNNYKLGTLSETFESNGNPAAIGFDTTGGYSYGKYQIETRNGTMQQYIMFLQNTPKYERFAISLNKSGGSNAAKYKTEEFANTWQRLSQNNEFNQSQIDFIVEEKLNKLLSRISDIKGLNLEHRHPVIKDVLYSLSVQHGEGGGSSVLHNALPKNINHLSDVELINRIYNERSNVDKYFKRSDLKTKMAVYKRFKIEHPKALQLLRNNYQSNP